MNSFDILGIIKKYKDKRYKKIISRIKDSLKAFRFKIIVVIIIFWNKRNLKINLSHQR